MYIYLGEFLSGFTRNIGELLSSDLLSGELLYGAVLFGELSSGNHTDNWT